MVFIEIFHDFGWLFATRLRIRIRFIEGDPDPADQNETDLELLLNLMRAVPNENVLLIVRYHTFLSGYWFGRISGQ